MSIVIRSATAPDAEGIARVHIDCWRTTYRGLIPQSYLDSLSYERRTQFWREHLETPGKGTHCVVAVIGKQIVGFSNAGPSRSPDLARGEVYAIYVLEAFQKQEIGRTLLEDSLARLKAISLIPVLVWVLETNPTKHFYEHMGAVCVSEKVDTYGDTPLNELGYVWNVVP